MNNETFLMDIELRASAVKGHERLTFSVRDVDRLRELVGVDAMGMPDGTNSMQATTALLFVHWARHEIVERVAKALSTNLNI